MSDEKQKHQRTRRGAWMFASVMVVAVLAFALAVLNRNFEINVMERLKIAVAADDKYVEVARLLSGDENADVAEAEGLLGSRGFYRIGREDEPIESGRIVSLLEAKGFYRLGRPGEPVDGDEVERVLASKGYRYIGDEGELIRDPGVTRALESKGYYHIGSQNLIDAIRRFDVDEFGSDPQLAQVFQARLRTALLDMMGGLEGPFEVETPGVLWDASTDFLRALDQLAAGLGQHDEASHFLTAFWREMADRNSVFGLTKFAARVRVVSTGDEHERIYVCEDNTYLGRRDLSLRTEVDAPVFGFSEVPRRAVPSPLACQVGTSPELAAALAGEPVPLAINGPMAREMFSRTTPPEPGFEFAATAVLQPGSASASQTE